MKKVLLIIFSIICFYGIEDVKAVSANGSLSCDKSVLKEGDVITFASADSRFEGTIITHRIIKKNPSTNNEGYTFRRR